MSCPFFGSPIFQTFSACWCTCTYVASCTYELTYTCSRLVGKVRPYRYSTGTVLYVPSAACGTVLASRSCTSGNPSMCFRLPRRFRSQYEVSLLVFHCILLLHWFIVGFWFTCCVAFDALSVLLLYCLLFHGLCGAVSMCRFYSFSLFLSRSVRIVESDDRCR